MTEIDEQGRPEPPYAGTELEILTGFVEFHRATLAWKCRGLGADGLRQRLPSSDLTLGGLVKHLAWVEDHWFGYRLHGLEPDEPWRSADWTADQDWEFTSAASDSPEELFALWEAVCERSRARTAEAFADGGLDRLCVRPYPDGRTPSLRWVLVHMVEEYCRHNGHADLLREAVDGETGE